MSAWKLLVRNLHAIGGEGTRAQFDDLSNYSNSATGLVYAQRLGLLTRDGRRQGTVWRLTELGRRYCEGEAEVRQMPSPKGGPGKLAVAASWLSSLPRDVRITAEAE